MIRFYAPDIATQPVLPEVESGHAVRVLRHKPGDILEVVDGRGMLYRCRLVDAHPKHAMVSVEECEALPKVWKPEITLAVAPTKSIDRMEWLVEKLVEIGIDRIVPLRCEHSERRQMNAERLERIAVSAMKQSLKAVLPRIDDVTPISAFLSATQGGQRFVAWCDDTSERYLLAKTYRAGSDVTILIGPEGDFTPDEVGAALGAGYVPVTLGDNRLRTETAALVAVDTIHVINQLNS